jgi:Secretion system C-terminal sorting domain
MIKNLLLVAIALFTFTSAQAGGFTILNATPPGPFTGGTTGHKIKFYVKEVAGSPPGEAFVNLLGTAIGTYKTGGSITATPTGPGAADITNITSAVDPTDPYIWVISFDIVAHPVGGNFTIGTDISITTMTGVVTGGVSTFTTFSATTLPIELSRFDASVAQNNVNLSWETLTESNNQKFMVERSFNGKDFSAIGELTGAGTSIATNNYAFEDKTAIATAYKVAYYRLKNVSFDGREGVSKQVAVKLRNTDAMTITNIAPLSSNLTFSTEDSNEVIISILNLNGQLISSTTVSAEKGLNQANVDFSNLEKGLYIVNLKTNASSVSKKFVF